MTESVRMAQWPAGDPEGEATHKIHCLCEFDVVRLRQEVTEYSQHAAEAIAEVNRLTDDRDTWRAAQEECHELHRVADAAIDQTWRPEVAALRAEVGRLQALQEATFKQLVAKCMGVDRLRGELEVEREAGQIQRHKAISNYAEVRRLQALVEAQAAVVSAARQRLASVDVAWTELGLDPVDYLLLCDPNGHWQALRDSITALDQATTPSSEEVDHQPESKSEGAQSIAFHSRGEGQ